MLALKPSTCSHRQDYFFSWAKNARPQHYTALLVKHPGNLYVQAGVNKQATSFALAIDKMLFPYV